MGIGTGVFLILIGAVLGWAVDIDLPIIDDDGMGMILLFAGIAVLVISVIMKTDQPGAGVGTGVAFLAAGAVLIWAIEIDVPVIDDEMLGFILLVVGVLSLAATGIVAAQHKYRRDRYERERYERDPRGYPGQGGPYGPPHGHPGDYGPGPAPRQDYGRRPDYY
ncbi:MAG: hypothetical protein GEV11_11810 [Streptosporangiales bacterium]|nr:hypothetical protein [Streptosporangiales bacterium]